YADLPKGYQITQDRSPICIGGSLNITVGDTAKAIRIHHVHMEEDAGKSMHDSDDAFSYIDLNRAGVPLLEIVSEPDLRSAEEVDAYMSAMRQLVQYLGVSDGNMQEGSMRCDCNVSVRPKGSDKLGERCEIKNLNSMRYARRAIEFEVKRQIDLIESGGRVSQQTLNFDPDTGETSPLRDKEDAHDYRYFPEPDLPPVILDERYVNKVREQMPSLPWEVYDRLQHEYGLSDYDATLLTAELPTAEYFLQLCAAGPQPKSAANLIINKLLPYCQEQQIALAGFPVSIDTLGQFIKLIEDEQVSNTNAYQTLLPELIENPGKAPIELAQSLQLIQKKDEDFLARLVEEVIAANPDKVKTYQNGKKGLLGFFMGEVMKRSKGQAEPKATNALLREKLEN
ncbi:MAG: Asp-tRNA(Asn)/Glu-tRNA(Gln) amidotransferase subunit GatB, partial [Lewinella sp.]|nr:Asp-tRNA(Asn)/Glu-tRNA(Gln) amidotransferase subunit GatB [Lewinella sp.]